MIRPRTRPPSPQPGGSALSTTESNAVLAPKADDKSSLPILIRLPEVAIPHSAKLALRLDWLAKLDWNHIRRVKLDPNWVAGGLLGLVLFLLIMITLNRGSKPDPNSPAQNDAPSWNAGNSKSSPASAAEASAANGPFTPAAEPNTQFAANASVAQPNGGIAPAHTDAGQAPLDGILYPQTPYPPLAGVEAPSQARVDYGSPPVQPDVQNGIHTALRDTSASRAFQSPSNSAYGGHAHFDGGITKPNEIRR
jgi:hypothetical protein